MDNAQNDKSVSSSHLASYLSEAIASLHAASIHTPCVHFTSRTDLYCALQHPPACRGATAHTPREALGKKSKET
jgi:hypothetical protein